MALKPQPQLNQFSGSPVPLSTGAPKPFIAKRDPTSADTGFPFGQTWINKSSNSFWVLTSVAGGLANWEPGGGSATVESLTADSGSATPSGGTITIAGGTNLTSSASGSTLTMNLDSSVTNLTSLASTTITTNVAAAQLSLNGTTMTATGSDANVSMNLATKGTGSILYTRSAAGVDLNLQITNSDNTAASSPAGLQVAVGGSTNTGDPYTQYTVSGAQTWTTGIDNSASDAYVIAASNALGTSNAASWSTAGALTNAGSITATLGNITATNGNLVLNTAGNKIVSTSVATTTTAGANSFGSVTLVGGTATVSTTAVTANSLIYIWRQSIGATGAAALGQLTVGTITASTSFVINAVQAADATALQATDVSVVGWMIVN